RRRARLARHRSEGPLRGARVRLREHLLQPDRRHRRRPAAPGAPARPRRARGIARAEPPGEVGHRVRGPVGRVVRRRWAGRNPAPRHREDRSGARVVTVGLTEKLQAPSSKIQIPKAAWSLELGSWILDLDPGGLRRPPASLDTGDAIRVSGAVQPEADLKVRLYDRP